MKTIKIDILKYFKVMNIRKFGLASIVIVTMFTACNDVKEHQLHELPPVTVHVSQVNSQNVSDQLKVSGQVQAHNSVNISTRNMGYVEMVNVEVGSKVTKGQQLIKINSNDLQAKLAQVNANIKQAEIGLANAEKDYNRFKALYAKQSVSQKEMDDMEAHYNMSKAGLDAATQMKNEVNAQFSYSSIVSPISGTITQKMIEVGDLANPGMPLLTIESGNEFEVMAMVPESAIGTIKKGENCDVYIGAINKTIKAKVSEISTSSKMTGSQYMVKIDLGKENNGLFSGMYANVTFTQPNSNSKTISVTMIPMSSLITQGDLRGVYTISDENTAVLRWLRLGITMGDQVEVLSGLKPNEKYITSAESKLYNGASVSIK